MDADELRDRQGPLKERYRAEPESGLVRMQARGTVNLQTLTCHVASRVPSKPAGLHPAAGGDGQAACSGDMLLDALVACSGVTLAAVATAMQQYRTSPKPVGSQDQDATRKFKKHETALVIQTERSD